MSQPVKLTRLAIFRDETSVSTDILATANYASNPRAHLTSKLGAATLASRENENLLFIPESIVKDVYGAGETKEAFETHVANLLGKSNGLFFQTGVQAQLLAMKIYAVRKGGNLCAWHGSCHLESAEMVSYKELYGLDRLLLGSDPDRLPTVDEIKAVLARPREERPVVVVVEIPNRTLGCETYTFSELEQLSAACKEADVMFHCDGAR